MNDIKIIFQLLKFLKQNTANVTYGKLLVNSTSSVLEDLGSVPSVELSPIVTSGTRGWHLKQA